jgi:transcriptional regulator with XRE-family HTH domain
MRWGYNKGVRGKYLREPKFNHQARELMIKMYSEIPRVPVVEIIKLMGCSRSTFYEIVRKDAGVMAPLKRKPEWTKVTPGDATDIRQLFTEGVTEEALAQRFGVKRSYISRIIRNKRHQDPTYTPPPKKDLWKRHQFHAGTKHHLVKLNIPKVKRIRRLYEKGWTLKRLAQRFGVNPSTIHAIARRRSWRHVEDGLGAISHRPETRGGKGKPGHAPTNAKLTAVQRDEIRAAIAPRKVLAERYGVSMNHITRIRHGRASGGKTRRGG